MGCQNLFRTLLTVAHGTLGSRLICDADADSTTGCNRAATQPDLLSSVRGSSRRTARRRQSEMMPTVGVENRQRTGPMSADCEFLANAVGCPDCAEAPAASLESMMHVRILMESSSLMTIAWHQAPH
jgi:hypothetical protein